PPVADGLRHVSRAIRASRTCGSVRVGRLDAEQEPGGAARVLLEPLRVGAAVVVEGAHAAPLADDPVEVDVRDRGAGALREALGLPQQVAALVDEGLPVPGEVRGGLPLARGRVDVGDLGAGGGGAGHELAIVGPADGDRGAGEVRDHGGTGERGLGRRGTGTHMSSQTSTNRLSPGRSGTVISWCGVRGWSVPPIRTGA